MLRIREGIKYDFDDVLIVYDWDFRGERNG
jgi:hypothetical protein